MSTHVTITGAIIVDTLATTTHEALFLANTVADALPRITGSERDARVYPVVLEGANCSSDTDAFNRRSDRGENGRGGNDWFDSQTRVLLAVHGDLRDRVVEDTVRETVRFLTRLARRFCIDECSVTVRGHSRTDPDGKSVTIADPAWLRYLRPAEWPSRLVDWPDLGDRT